MPIVIRNACLGDAVALGYIQVTSWRSAFRGIADDDYLDRQVSAEGQADDWREILTDSEQIVFVAEDNFQIVGYAWAHGEDDTSIEWDAELVSMHILPAYKRQGIGMKLFSTVVAELKLRGCKSIYLWVLEDNQPSRRFYEALGGQLAGRHQVVLGDKELTEVAYGWKEFTQLENNE